MKGGMSMQKKLIKIIEIPCEEDVKRDIASSIRDYLIENRNQDYVDGNVVIEHNRFEAVDVIIYEGCTDIPELIKILTFPD
jgi:hypothetical protein